MCACIIKLCLKHLFFALNKIVDNNTSKSIENSLLYYYGWTIITSSPPAPVELQTEHIKYEPSLKPFARRKAKGIDPNQAH